MNEQVGLILISNSKEELERDDLHQQQERPLQ